MPTVLALADTWALPTLPLPLRPSLWPATPSMPLPNAAAATLVLRS